MDKAYDGEEIRRVVHEDVRAARTIPLKEGAKSGTHRLAMREEFDEEKSCIIGGTSLRRCFLFCGEAGVR